MNRDIKQSMGVSSIKINIDAQSPNIKIEPVSQYTSDSFRWTPIAVDNLIQLVKANWSDFSNIYKKKKIVWEGISKKMIRLGFIVSAIECDKKFRNIKARYYLALENKMLRKSKSVRIEYFDELNNLLGCHPDTIAKMDQRRIELCMDSMDNIPNAAVTNFPLEDVAELISEDEDTADRWNAEAVGNLLSLLKEFKDCRNESKEISLSASTIWNIVSDHMKKNNFNFDAEECSQQWNLLVENYDMYSQTGHKDNWSYFDVVQDVVLTVPIPVSHKKGTKRKLSERKQETKKICLGIPPEDEKPSTSIKLELGDPSSDEELESSNSTATKDKPQLSIMKDIEEKFEIMRHLQMQESNLDNKINLQLKASLERSIELEKITALAMKSYALLSKLVNKDIKEENITIVIPNDDETQ